MNNEETKKNKELLAQRVKQIMDNVDDYEDMFLPQNRKDGKTEIIAGGNPVVLSALAKYCEHSFDDQFNKLSDEVKEKALTSSLMAVMKHKLMMGDNDD